MALIKGLGGSDYTKTGGNWFMRASNTMSYIPGGAFLGLPLGVIGTVIDSGKWLLRGKLLSALTAAGSGATTTLVNGAVSASGGAIIWNVASYGITGKSLSTHTRKITELGIGGVTSLVGRKPQVLQSYTAGIGGIGGGATPSGPGRFASAVSAERGQDANAAYANYMRGEGGVHVNELGSAYQSR